MVLRIITINLVPGTIGDIYVHGFTHISLAMYKGFFKLKVKAERNTLSTAIPNPPR
jgi:hypothetical protein